jgi:hypothetical protein
MFCDGKKGGIGSRHDAGTGRKGMNQRMDIADMLSRLPGKGKEGKQIQRRKNEFDGRCRDDVAGRSITDSRIVLPKV